MKAAGIYAFGPFRLHAASGVLYRHEHVVALARKPVEILAILVANAGTVVGREELIKEVWPDTYVEDANLTFQIATLRRTLAADAGGNDFIQTIPKRGYRFAGEARRTDDVIGQSAPPADSLAVLPLLNMSPDRDTDYFSDGLTEEITNAIVRSGVMHVVARTSAFQFRGAARDMREIGVRLNVRAVLDGSVRKSGDKLRVVLQLIDAANGYHLWSEVYDRKIGDVFEIQQQIAEAVASKFRGGSVGDALRRTCDIEAYHLYLKGRFLRNRTNLNDFERSIEYYRQALRRDPAYAPAYAGLAESYINLAWPFSYLAPNEAYAHARAAAADALKLDDRLADAHVALGLAELHFNRDLQGAEAAFRRAIALDPDHPNARHRYSHCLVAMNRMAESLDESLRCIDLDPLDATLSHHLGWHYRMAGEFDNAVRQHEKVLELEPDRELTRIFLGQALVGQRRYSEARQAYEMAFHLGRRGCGDLGWLAHVDALRGETEHAISALDKMIRQRQSTYVSPVAIARVYAALGDLESALRWLRRAAEDRDPNFAYAAVDPDLGMLRSDERFRDLLGEAGLGRVVLPGGEEQQPRSP